MASTNDEFLVLRPSDDRELTGILQNLADPVKTSSQVSFQREFGLLKTKIAKPGIWANIKEMRPLVQRCCQEKKFWAGGELDYLISMHCVSPRDVQMVFETLAEKKEVGVMYRALKGQPWGVVPEDCLVMALQCFLTVEEEILQKASDECVHTNNDQVHLESSTCPISKARCVFVDQVLGKYCECDEVFLSAALKKKLSFSSVVTLLGYILHMTKSVQEQKEADRLSQWKGQLLDAHATQLVLSKDAHQLLVELSKEEEANKQFVDTATEDLMPLLKVAMTACTDKGKRAMGQYCIEVLHL